MRRDLSPDDVSELLARPLLAVLGTRTRDDDILLSPVWHEWRDSGFTVFTDPDDVKARHLRRDPRGSIVVCEHEPPYRGIEVRGEAHLLANGDTGTMQRIAARYLGDTAAADWTDPAAILIRITPGTQRVWDFADEYPAQ
jgi:PPOX class probable F420-dependent enzyme